MTTGVATTQPETCYAPKHIDGFLTERFLERSDNVLWTLAPPGILLHNLELQLYFELDAVGYLAWGFLDGARSVDQVVSRCLAHFPQTEHEQTAANLIEIIKTLHEYRFIKDREDA